MKKLSPKDVTRYVEDNIRIFHIKRIEGLKRLELKTVLQKKEPLPFQSEKFTYF